VLESDAWPVATMSGGGQSRWPMV